MLISSLFFCDCSIAKASAVAVHKKKGHTRERVCPLVKVWLEVQLQAELDVTREVRAGHRTESRIAEVVVHTPAVAAAIGAEVGMVEGVEEFPAELNPVTVLISSEAWRPRL